MAPAIAAAIRDAGLNLNPSVEDNVVKVPLPKYAAESQNNPLPVTTAIHFHVVIRISSRIPLCDALWTRGCRISKEVREASLKTLAKVTEEVQGQAVTRAYSL